MSDDNKINVMWIIGLFTAIITLILAFAITGTINANNSTALQQQCMTLGGTWGPTPGTTTKSCVLP